MAKFRLKEIKTGKNKGIYLIGSFNERQDEWFENNRDVNDGYDEFSNICGAKSYESVIIIGGFAGRNYKLKHGMKLLNGLNKIK